MLILLTAMLVLLPILAALQYHWLGQVSDAATERLQVNLRAGAVQFRQDFNREFIRAYLNFHMDSLALPQDIERYHLERLEQWTRTAPNPQLISEVFTVTYDDQARFRLSRLNHGAKRFEVTEWAGELVSFRERFVRPGEQVDLRVGSSDKDSIESFAEDIPALIIPFPLSSADKSTARTPPLPSGFTIIKLNLNYLKTEFIPSLIQRDLFDSSNTEYDVAVISLRHPDQVIYSSSYPLVDLSSSDASTRIFGLESDELRTFLRREGAGSVAGDQSRPLRLINLRYLKGPSATSGEEDGHWQLLIKHRAGTLAAAVSTARHRNLAISFGILLLLGAGILMTAISTRRAERLARQQINFVAGVSHELRTPLAVICSAGENLADGIVESPEKVTQYGNVIYEEGRRLTEMVEQVLEFAGGQSGRQRYELQSIAAADFIGDALAACQPQIQEMNFTVEVAIEPNLPLLRGDAAALKRAVQNLISNSVKYDGENHWARISAGKQGDEIRITVEDRGQGISPADIAHIFEPFYRGHEAVAAQIKGSGVGLSLVRQIVEAHGGRIAVKSVPGTGTSFTLHFPAAAQA